MTQEPFQPRHDPESSTAVPRSGPNPQRTGTGSSFAPPYGAEGRPHVQRGDLAAKLQQGADKVNGEGDDGQDDEDGGGGGGGGDSGDAEEDDGEDGDDDGEDDDDDDDEEEPQLKYARLTQHLTAVYRNGDATSASIVAGDKMVRPPRNPFCRRFNRELTALQIVGTHNGNIVSPPRPLLQRPS